MVYDFYFKRNISVTEIIMYSVLITFALFLIDLDDPCTSDEECITENSKCGEVCRCKVNYIQSHQKNVCLRG